MEGTASLALIFFAWWYGEAFTKFVVFAKYAGLALADLFSVKICLRTLFAPWKRDQYSAQGLSLQDQFHILVLNLVSRFVGMMVKLIVIGVFCLVFFLYLLLSFLAIVLWLAWPVLGILFIVEGVIKVRW